MSVYSARSPDATIRYKITYIQSDRNLYHLSAEGRAPSAVNGARIKRVDAELPEKTAKLVKQVWLRLLRDARGTYPPARDQWEAVPTDLTQVEFSVQGETANAEFGLLNLFLATQRSKVEKLLHIGNDFVSYCKVSPEKRLRIAANINKEANELLAELH